jgi:hypothetical protein
MDDDDLAQAPVSIAELDGIILAPHPQGTLLGFGLQFVPVIERASSSQQILEPGVGASSAEKLPDLVEIAGQELAGEVERERLAEVEIALVGYRQKFPGVVDIIRQGVQVVGELGMTRDFARLPAEKSLMLTAAGGADEYEGFPEVLQADGHGNPPQ